MMTLSVKHTTAKESTMPASTFTATASQHGKTRRITVRDAAGNVTGKRGSATMHYVAVWVTGKGGVISAHQTVQAAVKAGPVAWDPGCQMLTVVEAKDQAGPPAITARLAFLSTPQGQATATAKGITGAPQAEAKAAARKARRAARKAALTPEQVAAKAEARRARRQARKEAAKG